MEYKFSALSSNKFDRYLVVVTVDSRQVKISCGCPAKVLCKHAVALITGKTEGMFPLEHNESHEIDAALQNIKNSGISDSFDVLNAQLEKVKVEFKRQEKEIKHQMNLLCTENS